MPGVPLLDSSSKIVIQLHESIEDDAAALLQVSQGTEPVSARPRVQGPFDPQARLPRGPWHRPPRLVTLPDDETPDDPGHCVTLVDLGKEVVAPFQALGFHDALNPAEAWRLNDSPEAPDALRALVDRALTRLRGSPSRVSRVVPRLAGLQGVTVDCDKDGRYVGLHVDSWEGLSIAQRHLSERRLCINLGSGDRFLLFIDLGLASVVRALGDACPEGRFSATDLARRFMVSHPNHPVLRLRIRPGQAYLAPTENLIHDASTEGQTGLDLSVVLSGHFDVSPKEQTHVAVVEGNDEWSAGGRGVTANAGHAGAGCIRLAG